MDINIGDLIYSDEYNLFGMIEAYDQKWDRYHIQWFHNAFIDYETYPYHLIYKYREMYLMKDMK